MGRDGPHWTAADLDDDLEEPGRPPRRSRLLLVLAVAPWLVVVWLLGRPGVPQDGQPAASLPGGTEVHAEVHAPDEGSNAPAPDVGSESSHPDNGSGAPPTDEGSADAAGPAGTEVAQAPTSPSDEPAPAPAGAAPPTAAGEQDGTRPDPDASAWQEPAGTATEPGLVLLEQRGRWRVEAGAEEAAALAVVVARAWLTDHEPRLSIAELATPDVGRYAEHLVVEAVEATTPELTVVTLLAVLLDGQDELTTTVRRVAVPIALDARGARPAGSPWWLPGPDLTPAAPPTRPVEDAADLLEAVEALQAAGYEDVTLERLEDLGGAAAVATVTARTPDGEPHDGPVVLRRHVDRYVVAGDVLTRAESGP